MKKQGDFVVYSRNSVLINALVAFSRQVFLPEGPTEHLTLVYLDPAAASAAPTGEQLRNSIKVQADVPPLAEGAVNGWKEVANLTQQLTAEEAIAVRTIPSAADLDGVAAEQKAKEATDPSSGGLFNPEGSEGSEFPEGVSTAAVTEAAAPEAPAA